MSCHRLVTLTFKRLNLHSPTRKTTSWKYKMIIPRTAVFLFSNFITTKVIQESSRKQYNRKKFRTSNVLGRIPHSLEREIKPVFLLLWRKKGLLWWLKHRSAVKKILLCLTKSINVVRRQWIGILQSSLNLIQSRTSKCLGNRSNELSNRGIPCLINLRRREWLLGSLRRFKMLTSRSHVSSLNNWREISSRTSTN